MSLEEWQHIGEIFAALTSGYLAHIGVGRVRKKAHPKGLDGKKVMSAIAELDRKLDANQKADAEGRRALVAELAELRHDLKESRARERKFMEESRDNEHELLQRMARIIERSVGS